MTDVRVLVIEDEEPLADSIKYNLELEGYGVDVAHGGNAGLRKFKEGDPSLVLLDVMLPEISGLDLCRMFRATSDVPIIMITARDSEADKVAGLELGADDYVTKPFSMRELLARVRANLRRHGMKEDFDFESEVLSGGPVSMDVARHEVEVAGEAVALRPREFELLATFLRNRGLLMTRDRLITDVWGIDYFGDTKTLDVHIKRIRKKIEPDPKKPQYLVTVRGLGYKFVDD
ncbi:MAG: response regulator transcription factor [Acidimicrobiia bacterium]|nr:response regulator transcription factor [Acidimicrobiia bacterium]MBT8216999.1 response regulator transcription factor [Acidimicrobiia bacterium]NNF10511.1 response regulator transcription factor [Acidimicrobiia bacterium]NNL70279.1 response regulator transcription factor [Acidimicrobiia bacterium]